MRVVDPSGRFNHPDRGRDRSGCALDLVLSAPGARASSKRNVSVTFFHSSRSTHQV